MYGDDFRGLRLKSLAALTEDMHWVPSTHVGQVKNACDSSSWGFITLFWPLWAHVWHVYTEKKKGRGGHVHINKILKNS